MGTPDYKAAKDRVLIGFIPLNVCNGVIRAELLPFLIRKVSVGCVTGLPRFRFN